MIEIKENVPLAPFTTYGVGGDARYFTKVNNEDELRRALAYARDESLALLVLGGGSNVLISDKGFDGLVIENKLKGWKEDFVNSEVLVTVGAGENWDDVVARTVKSGWAGIECLSGIPGTVGGAVVQNIGAYGQTLGDVVSHVSFLDTTSGLIEECNQEACDFAYRDSRFKKADSGRYIILSITLNLEVRSTSACNYQDYRFNVAEHMKRKKDHPTLQDVRDAVLNVREQKGMLRMPGRSQFDSAGSVFKNPVVDKKTYEQVLEVAQKKNADLEKKLQPWSWPVGDKVKISAAFLLEFTQFHKGFVRGAVGISPKHSLSVINLGGANAAELHALIDDMQTAVEKLFGITLEREIVVL